MAPSRSPHSAVRATLAAQLWPDRIRHQCGMWNGNWTQGEPALSEMLDDPIIQAVMTSDHVSRSDIEKLFARSFATHFVAH